MRQIYISSVENGMILARNIVDENDKVLLKKGATLTKNIAQKLESMGYPLLCIEDENTNDIEIRECIPLEKKRKIIDSLKYLDLTKKTVDYTKITESANEIVESIAKYRNIAFDLLDIRNDKNYDYNHSLGVAELSVAIALECKDAKGNPLFDNDKLKAMAQAGLLHEIGKRCKDNKVAAKLNIKEYKEDDETLYGTYLLKDAIIQNRAALTTSILFSKTNVNGSKCPRGFEEYVKNKEIYIGSKILHLADYYNSLISNKVEGYSNLSPAGAAEVIVAGTDIKFDKDIVKTFISKVAIFPIGSTVKLSNGEFAIVIKNNIGDNEFNYRPVVRTDSGIEYDLLEYKNLTIIKNIDEMNQVDSVITRKK